MLARIILLCLVLTVVCFHKATVAMSCEDLISESSRNPNGIVGFKKIDPYIFGQTLIIGGTRVTITAAIKEVPRSQSPHLIGEFKLIPVDELFSGSVPAKKQNYKRILIINFDGNYDVDRLSAEIPVSVADKGTADVRRELLLEVISELRGRIDAVQYSWKSDLYSWRNIEETAANSEIFSNTGRISVKDLDNTLVGNDLNSLGFYAKTILVFDFYRLEPNQRQQVQRLVVSQRDLNRTLLDAQAIFELRVPQ